MPLNPDLEARKAQEKGMTMIRHPLVYAVPFFGSDMEIEFANKYYDQKRQQLEVAIKQKDVQRIAFLHERPYRLAAFIEHYHLIEEPFSDEFWKILATIWRDSENIWQNITLWETLFEQGENSGAFMTTKDSRHLGYLFEGRPFITVYRGGQFDGLSYTTDKDKALWFAKRFQGKAHIFEKEVSRCMIFAYTDARDEKEIILKSRTVQKPTP